MAQRNTRRTGASSGRTRTLSKRQRAIYRRRRIVVGTALLIVLLVVGLCLYSLARGVGAIADAMPQSIVGKIADAMPQRVELARDGVPDPPKTSGIKDCTAKDLDLTLSAQSQTVAVGGSLNFTATLTYTGSSKKGCLVDASDAGRVLTITSGDETIWTSDACEADPRMLLMAKGNEDKAQITWPTQANGGSCTEGTPPTVNAGTYVARLSMRDLPKLTSDSVVVTVQ